jgi:heptosyltransferase-2
MTVRGPRHGTLIVQPLPGIGDMIWHLPHIHSIAATEGTPVTVLTKARSRGDRIFIADPAVAGVLWLERNPGRHSGLSGMLRLARELRRRRYAKAWLLHGSGRYAWVLLLAGIPVTIGYGRGAQRWLLSESLQLPPDETHGHAIMLADRLLAAHGIRRVEDEPVLVVDPAAAAKIDARYGQRPRPWIALGIGSSEASKQWGAANFASLATALAAQGAGTIFAVGGPADASLARELLHRIGPNPSIVAVTDIPIDQTAALLKQCALYVGNDTGALNVAAAAGTHAIGLFGASPPLLHSRHVHVVEPPALSPSKTMQAITVDSVLAEVSRRLAGTAIPS